MDPRQIQIALNANGFPCGAADGIIGPNTKAAVRRFQQAYNGPDGWLTVDGIPGPKTQNAVAELPYLSPHFAVGEVACHHCGLAYVKRELLNDLETLRSHLGTPLPIIDAYRCKFHNAEVGGAGVSMHLEGLAADTAPVAPWESVWAQRLFSGIGDRRGLISHVDLRHLSPKNLTPNATPEHPARWTY
jgi:hypothetical protein